MNHYQIIKYFYLSIILLFITSCDISSLSDNEITDLSVIKAKIIIEETYNGSNIVKVFLSDGKKQIISKNIKVKLNGNLLEFWVINELYYSTKSYYTNLTTKPNEFCSEEKYLRSNSYYFEIILPDSTIYPLAYIKPINQIDIDNFKFSIPKSIPKNKDFILQWQNLNFYPVLLTIDKHCKTKKIKEYNKTQSSKITRLQKTINSSKGKYFVPISFFEDSLTIAENLKIKFSYENTGLINPELIKGSNISYKFILEKEVSLNK